MVEGTDYGIIPGTKGNTLLKPGAEKLTDLFRCTPNYQMTTRIEDWEKPLFHYEFRCEITSRDTGTILAVGVGSANSMEGRYRWRQSSRKCPACGKEAIIKGKDEFGGGWVCFKKKDGCGAKFKDGDQAIESQPSGKIANDDVYTAVNSILKMAKKRALVDAAIALARCSDIFTQDMEDGADADHHEATKPQPRPEPQRSQQPPKPADVPADVDPYLLENLKVQGTEAANKGNEPLKLWWLSLNPLEQKELETFKNVILKPIAANLETARQAAKPPAPTPPQNGPATNGKRDMTPINKDPEMTKAEAAVKLGIAAHTGREMAKQGTEALKMWFGMLSPAMKGELAGLKDELKPIAQHADSVQQVLGSQQREREPGEDDVEIDRQIMAAEAAEEKARQEAPF